MSEIQGTFLHFNDRGEFVYAYRCSVCGRTFRDSTPEVSAPALCHSCVTGKRCGADNTMPSGKRRPRHEPKE